MTPEFAHERFQEYAYQALAASLRTNTAIPSEKCPTMSQFELGEREMIFALQTYQQLLPFAIL